jgi:hypothetical protein
MPELWRHRVSIDFDPDSIGGARDPITPKLVMSEPNGHSRFHLWDIDKHHTKNHYGSTRHAGDMTSPSFTSDLIRTRIGCTRSHNSKPHDVTTSETQPFSSMGHRQTPYKNSLWEHTSCRRYDITNVHAGLIRTRLDKKFSSSFSWISFEGTLGFWFYRLESTH